VTSQYRSYFEAPKIQHPRDGRSVVLLAIELKDLVQYVVGQSLCGHG
jgi:hypothetical protein